MAKILIVDDDIMVCRLLDHFLKKKGYTTNYFTNGKKAIEDLKKDPVDLVFCDYRLPDTDGKEMLMKIKEINSDIQVIIITAYADIKKAIDIIKSGAFEYITKPFLPEEISLMTEKALALKSTLSQRDENPAFDKKLKSESKPQILTSKKNWIVGKSKEARELQSQIELVAPTNYSVIIYGESGIGKESVAAGIHHFSSRKDRPFIAVDCGALTKELAGSELFGHEKGAFTGALQSKTGQFELANGGTIFLDEIANLSYDIQISLLRVIQERKIRKLGSSKESNIDVRIIAASNSRLVQAIENGKFREDLYHRLNEFSIELPPIRERKLDILIFAGHFLEEANREIGKKIEDFDLEVKKIFQEYNWPGNLREMNNVIKRAALISTKNFITPDALPGELVFQSKSHSTKNESNIDNLSSSKNSDGLKVAALHAEYEKIMEVLRKVNYNKSKASKLLNIDRKTLYNKVKSFRSLEGS
jgi:two-component system response regulator HydG